MEDTTEQVQKNHNTINIDNPLLRFIVSAVLSYLILCKIKPNIHCSTYCLNKIYFCHKMWQNNGKKRYFENENFYIDVGYIFYGSTVENAKEAVIYIYMKIAVLYSRVLGDFKLSEDGKSSYM